MKYSFIAEFDSKYKTNKRINGNKRNIGGKKEMKKRSMLRCVVLVGNKSLN